MIGGYITVREAADKWNLNERTVQTMCGDGRIPSAKKFGRVWAIPENIEAPADKRVKTGAYIGWRKKAVARCITKGNK